MAQKIDIHLNPYSSGMELKAYLWSNGELVASLSIYEEVDVLMATLGPLQLQRAVQMLKALSPATPIYLHIDAEAQNRLEKKSAKAFAKFSETFASMNPN